MGPTPKEHSRAILSNPFLISLAKIVVGTANSKSRIGLVEVEFDCIQNFTFPFLYPKMVPVRKEAEENGGGFGLLMVVGS